MQGKNEFSVGLFALVGLVLFAGFVFSIGKFTGPTRPLDVEFTFVDGLTADAVVQYAGYRVGKVRSITILPRTPERPQMLRARLQLPDDLPVYRNSEIAITSMGLMGEKIIEIMPGGVGEPARDGDVLRGRDPMMLSKLFDQFSDAIGKDEQGGVKQIVSNVIQLTADLNEMTGSLRVIIAGNEKELDKLIENLSAGSEHLPGLMKSSEAAAARIEKVAEQIEMLSKQLNQVADDGKPEIKKMIQNFNETSENLKALSADVRKHPWKLIRK